MNKSKKNKRKKNTPKKIEEENLIANIATSNELGDEAEYYQILDKENNHYFLKFFFTILVIILCLAFLYKYVILNPKAIFNSGLNNSYNYINNILNYLDSNSYFNTPTKIDGVLTTSTTDPNYKDLDNYKFNITSSIDIDNKIYNSELSFLKSNTELMNINYYVENNNDYLELTNIYNNIIQLAKTNTSDTLLNNINKIDYTLLNKSLKSIKDIINNNISYNQIKSDEKNKYVSLSLSKEEYSKILSNVIKDIETNNKLKSDLAASFGIDVETITNKLNDLLSDTLTKSFDTIEFIYYYDSYLANVNALEVKEDNQTMFKYDGSALYLKYKYNNYDIKFDNNQTLTIYQDNKELITFTFNELNSKTIDADYITSDSLKGNIHFNLKDNSYGNVTLSLINNYAYSLDFDYQITSNTTVNKVDESKVVDIKSVSEDDYLTIYNKLKNNTKDTLLGDYVTKYIESLLKY